MFWILPNIKAMILKNFFLYRVSFIEKKSKKSDSVFFDNNLQKQNII